MSNEPIQADEAGNVTKFGDDVSPTIQAAIAFVRGLDANARERLIATGMAAFDQYVTSMPGPDFFDSTAKATARPHIEVAIRNAINDLCGGA